MGQFQMEASQGGNVKSPLIKVMINFLWSEDYRYFGHKFDVRSKILATFLDISHILDPTEFDKNSKLLRVNLIHANERAHYEKYFIDFRVGITPVPKIDVVMEFGNPFPATRQA